MVVGGEGHGWSSSPGAAGAVEAGYLCFDVWRMEPLHGWHRSSGFAVRCVQHLRELPPKADVPPAVVSSGDDGGTVPAPDRVANMAASIAPHGLFFYLCGPISWNKKEKIKYKTLIMKIVREQREGGSSLLRVKVGEADYAQEVEKMLRDYRRKANIPGFRPGMVPMGIVKKMYGKGVLAEQSYRLASNAAFDYLQKEKIDYLGDVIPSDEQGDFDFENGKEFDFVFEFGEAPEIKLDLTEKDKVTYNRIKVDKKMHDDYRSNFLRRFGRLVDTGKVTSDEALSVTLDNGDMNVADAYVGLISLSEEERKPFIGKKVGDKMEVNINELYKNPSQRAAVLQVKQDELEGINPAFSLEITKIRKFAEPELNEEFFKMAFPAGNVTSEADLDKFVDEEIAKELSRESDYLFTLQLRDYLIKKAGLKMPEAFLKRWLYTINEGKFSMEEIEKDFDQFLKMFTWNYMQKHFIQSEKIAVSKDEAVAEAKALAAAQFAQYGMPSAPDDMLAGYAEKILADKEQGQKIYEKLYEVKVVESVKQKIKVTEKAVSADDFASLAKEL